MGDGADGGNVFNHSIGAPISAQYWVTERCVCVCVDALSWYSARGPGSPYDARVYNHSIGAPRIIHREGVCVDALSWYSARGLESSYDARVYNHSIGAPRIIHITGAQSIARGLESSMALILLCISQCSPCNLKF